MTADLITERATKCHGQRTSQHGDAGQRREARPRWDRAGQLSFHHATKNGVPCKTYELFISRIFFHLTFLEQGGPGITKTMNPRG